MSDHDDCLDPSGVPFDDLDPALLRTRRTSLKWTRFAADVLPLFVAEMDFAVAPVIRRTLVERIEASDTGYLDGPGPLAAAFADFCRDRWAWTVPHDHVHLATDVATGVVEALRVLRPEGGRIAVPVPTYPGFFEMLEEVPFDVVEVPLREDAAVGNDAGAGPAAVAAGLPAGAIAPARLDLAALEREFAGSGLGTGLASGTGSGSGSGAGIDALILCNPHNPHGTVHTRDELAELARLAARYDVLVVSDEIHAPLTHAGETFVPFAPIAAAAGALSVTVTSASKGWNLAGGKCSVIVAADERANEGLKRLPPETVTRASILGLHANVSAFADGRDWLDRAIAQIERNDALLGELVAEHLPGVRRTKPAAGYLAWLDFRGTALGERAYERILDEGRVAFGDGLHFGGEGAGHVRVNLACAPATLREAVRRVAAVLRAAEGAPPAQAPPASTQTSTPVSPVPPTIDSQENPA
ncbi:aminotransferase class I/II-fold pyridoxal phosphate-dependent enzyme [Leucobacter sp. gxy201]|uniref:MalY/PatB family protein n=1 Tax=Leucobacter sp. gxy201 TaxID=2957200 RepID=UPI003DA18DFF